MSTEGYLWLMCVGQIDLLNVSAQQLKLTAVIRLQSIMIGKSCLLVSYQRKSAYFVVLDLTWLVSNILDEYYTNYCEHYINYDKYSRTTFQWKAGHLHMCVFWWACMTLTLTRWPLYSTLTQILRPWLFDPMTVIYEIDLVADIPKMYQFLGQGLQKSASTRQTDVTEHVGYAVAVVPVNILCLYGICNSKNRNL